MWNRLTVWYKEKMQNWPVDSHSADECLVILHFSYNSSLHRADVLMVSYMICAILYADKNSFVKLVDETAFFFAILLRLTSCDLLYLRELWKYSPNFLQQSFRFFAFILFSLRFVHFCSWYFSPRSGFSPFSSLTL